MEDIAHASDDNRRVIKTAVAQDLPGPADITFTASVVKTVGGKEVANGSRAITIPVNQIITTIDVNAEGGADNATMAVGDEGSAYSQSIVAVTPAAGASFAWTVTGLPAEMEDVVHPTDANRRIIATRAGQELPGPADITFTAAVVKTVGGKEVANGSRAITIPVNQLITTCDVNAEGGANDSTLPTASEGASYTGTVMADTDTAGATFAWTITGLPAELEDVAHATDTNRRVIQTQAGQNMPGPTDVTFTASVIKTVGGKEVANGSRVITIPVDQIIANIDVNAEGGADNATLPVGDEGSAYAQNVVAVTATAGATFEWTVTGLPTELEDVVHATDSNRRVIQTKAGQNLPGPADVTFTASVIKRVGGIQVGNGSRSITIPINAIVTTIDVNAEGGADDATLPIGDEGMAYAQNVMAVTTTAGATFEWTITGLPPEMEDVAHATDSNRRVIKTQVGQNLPGPADITFTAAVIKRIGGKEVANGSRAVTIPVNQIITTCDVNAEGGADNATLPIGDEGASYTQNVVAVTATTGASFAWTITGLPPEMEDVAHATDTNRRVIQTQAGQDLPGPADITFTASVVKTIGGKEVANGSRAITIPVNQIITTVDVNAEGGADQATLPIATEGASFTGTVGAMTTRTGTITWTVTGLPAELEDVAHATDISKRIIQTRAGQNTPGPADITFTAAMVKTVGGKEVANGSRVITIPVDQIIATIDINAEGGADNATLPAGNEGSAYAQNVMADTDTVGATFAWTFTGLPAEMEDVAHATDTNRRVVQTLAGQDLPGPADITFTASVVKTVGGKEVANGSRVITIPVDQIIETIDVDAQFGADDATLPVGDEGSSYAGLILADTGTTGATFEWTITGLPVEMVDSPHPSDPNRWTVKTDTGQDLPGPSDITFTASVIKRVGGIEVGNGSRLLTIPINPIVTTCDVNAEGGADNATLPIGDEGSAYSQTIMADTTTAGAAFAWTITGLPAEMEDVAHPTDLNRRIIKTLAGQDLPGPVDITFTASVTKTVDGKTVANGSRIISIPINPIIETIDVNAEGGANDSTLPTATSGAAYSGNIVADTDTAGATFAWTITGLPIELEDGPHATDINRRSIKTKAGETMPGPADVVFTASVIKTVGGKTVGTGSRSITIPVDQVIENIDVNAEGGSNNATLPVGDEGSAYSQQIVADTVTTGATFDWTITGLPPELEDVAHPTDVNRRIIKTRTGDNLPGPADITFTASVIKRIGGIQVGNGSRSITIPITALIATIDVNAEGGANDATLPVGSEGAAYAQNLVADTGTSGAVFAWTVTGLPPELEDVAHATDINRRVIKNRTGDTMPGPADISFTASVVKTVGGKTVATGSRDITLPVDQIIATIDLDAEGGADDATLPVGDEGSPYVQTIVADTDTAGASFAWTITGLPPEMEEAVHPMDLNRRIIKTLGGQNLPGPADITFDASVVKTVGGKEVANGSRTITIPVNQLITTIDVNAEGGADSATMPAGDEGSGYAGLIMAATDTAGATFEWTITGLPAELVDVAHPTDLNRWTIKTDVGQDLPGPADITFDASVIKRIGGKEVANGSRSITIPINQLIATIDLNAEGGADNATLPVGDEGSAYSQTVMANTGTAGATFAWTFTGLPAQLEDTAHPTDLNRRVIKTLTGQDLPGPADITFNASVVKTVGGKEVANGSRSITIPITALIETLDVNAEGGANDATLPTATEGAAYTGTVMADTDTAGATFAWTITGLPSELEDVAHATDLNRRVIQTQAGQNMPGPGDVTFTASVVKTVGGKTVGNGSRSITIPVNQIVASIDVNAEFGADDATLPVGDEGSAYAQSIVADTPIIGATFEWTITGLPPELEDVAHPTDINRRVIQNVSGLDLPGPADITFTASVLKRESGILVGTGTRDITIPVTALVVPFDVNAEGGADDATMPNANEGSAFTGTVIADTGTTDATFTWMVTGLPSDLEAVAHATDPNRQVIQTKAGETMPGPTNATFTASVTKTVGGKTVGAGSRLITIPVTALVTTFDVNAEGGADVATLPVGTEGSTYGHNIVADTDAVGATFDWTITGLPAEMEAVAHASDLHRQVIQTVAGDDLPGPADVTFTASVIKRISGIEVGNGSRIITIPITALVVPIDVNAQGGTDDATLPSGDEGSAYGENVLADTSAVGASFSWTVTGLPPELEAVAHATEANQRVIQTVAGMNLPGPADVTFNLAVDKTVGGKLVGQGDRDITIPIQPIVETIDLNAELGIDADNLPAAVMGLSYAGTVHADTDPTGATFTWTVTGLPTEMEHVPHGTDLNRRVIRTQAADVMPGPADEVFHIEVDKVIGGKVVGHGANDITIPVLTDSVGPTAEFLDGAGTGALPSFVAIADDTTPTTVGFTVRVTDGVGFTVDDTVITFTATARDGAVSTATLSSASPWTLVGASFVSISNLGTLGSGEGTSQDFEGTLSLTSEFEYVEIEVAATDLVGNTTTPDIRIDIAVPTEAVLLLDYSGSMNSAAEVSGTPTAQSKWEAAQSAGNLFAGLYGALWPDMSNVSNTVNADNKLSIARFYWVSGADATSVPALASVASVGTVSETDPVGNNLTPITCALRRGRDKLLDSVATTGWRNRVMMLMTDGMHNRPNSEELTDVSDDLAGYGWSVGDPLPTTFVPSVTNPTDASIGGAKAGIKIHSVTFAPTSVADQDALAAISTAYQGMFHATALDALPESSDALRAKFVSLLADTLPVEYVDPVSGNDFDIEHGVAKVAFVVTSGTGTLTASTTAPSDGTTVTASTASTVNDATNGYSYLIVENPAGGTWTLSGVPAGATAFAVVDLSLRTRFGVSPQGVGNPVTIHAEVRFDGLPVSGADVRVKVSRPLESVGSVLTRFATTGNLTLALASGRTPALNNLIATHPATFYGSAAASRVALPRSYTAHVAATPAMATAAIPPATAMTTRSAFSVQGALLTAVQDYSQQEFEYVDELIQLTEVRPGRYEATLAAAFTQEDGLYNFTFSARGLTPGRSVFSRSYQLTSNLLPLPDPAHSTHTWEHTPAPAGKLNWQLTALPRTATTRPLGPGLSNKLAFQYVDPADEKRFGPLEIVDNLDGTYSAALLLDPQQPLPEIGLVYKQPCSAAAPGDLTVPPVDPPAAEYRYVKVIVDKIQVLDSKDSCFDDVGELAFDTVVAPNLNPNRAMRRRIPERGHLRLGDGATATVGEVIFEGWLEQGATLDISIGGTEFDWFLFWTRREKLARYRRVLRGDMATWAGQYGPDDEPSDPEHLDDWKLWFTVEVD